MILKRAASVIAVLSLSLALSACGGTEDKEATQTPEPEPTPSESNWKYDGLPPEEAVEKIVEDTYPDNEQENGSDEIPIFDFGDVGMCSSGFTVSVSEPEEYTPDKHVTDSYTGGTALKFEITVTNENAGELQADSARFSMQSGGVAGQKIYDTTMLDSEVRGTILPGKSASWPVAFEVTDPNDLVLEVSVGGGADGCRGYFVK